MHQCHEREIARQIKLSKRPTRDIEILYEDADIIAVDKPAWLLSVPGRGVDKLDSVAYRVQQRYPGAEVVHRLDWATSGLMIMARNKTAQRHINKQFEARLTQKRYIAIVYGLVEPSEQTVELPLRCDWDNRPRQIVDFEQGKPATTIIKVDKPIDYQGQPATRLILTPITGRSHQLRVHCQQIGHFIIGDELYSPESLRHLSPRLLLHAEWLQLMHPSTDKPIEFICASPF
ncbi:pseudouridine synthase [Ostreibacterium oceani]|uniref:RNA pseudouridine synthase n=1 Tax=Ostreibacterium oceani TaxID=2654998 RepID=A0A6N7EV49_9GAMM|nr:pseudouridine synthase [Ostreibacterium oceani]MPV86644.1 RNA pseudouridine synthase [Ostreibacterium oceani]